MTRLIGAMRRHSVASYFAITGLVMSAIVGGRPGIEGVLRRMVQWRAPPTWYLVALSPLAFFAAAAVMGMPSVAPRTSQRLPV